MLKQLTDFLSKEHVDFKVIRHSPAYTSQRTAESAHVPGKEMAKTVIAKLDGKLAMIVLPAPEYLDLELLKSVSGARDVSLAEEDEFKTRFPSCEVGAMPPFGNLYGMDVYVEKELSENQEILFNAGTHTELVRMGYKDFERLVNPSVTALSHSYV